MSTFLAVGAVSAVLRGLIEDSATRHDLATVLGAAPTVSALPPDRITAGAGTPDRINLFLFQATENAAWRNMDFPSRNGHGDRLTNPKLALDLHYLVTAYGSAEFRAEVLLGHAMFVLHETPVVTRQAIRAALAALPASGLSDALELSRLADQFEQIKIVPRVLNVEEVSKIWTALQSQYRTTAAYQVTVALIEAEQPARSALPVLTRGQPVAGGDEGVFVHSGLQPPVPTLESIQLPAEKQLYVRLGETLSLRGHHLAGTNPRVRFRLLRGTDVWELAAAPGANDSRMDVQLPPEPPAPPVPPVPPNDPLNPDNWRVGAYEVTALVTQGGQVRETNFLPLILAPRVNPPIPVGGVPASIQVMCSPPIRPTQSAVLIVGQRELRPAAFKVPTKNLSFPIPTPPNALPSGAQAVRLRVDGVDSLVVNYAVRPPQFDATQTVVLP